MDFKMLKFVGGRSTGFKHQKNWLLTPFLVLKLAVTWHESCKLPIFWGPLNSKNLSSYSF